MAHVDKLLYNPGKLRTMGDLTSSTTDEFCNLGRMYPNCNCFGNMWVRETIWCKWIQWYGIEDGHVLDRCTPSTRVYGHWPNIPISLKGDLSARVGHISKVFYASEKCGYIELQLRRIFGVTHDTETQLWLFGNTGNPLVLDRGKALTNYTAPEVRYDTVFFSLVTFRN